MEVRRRHVNSSNQIYSDNRKLNLIKNLDLFSKLPNECKKSTSSGGIGMLYICLSLSINYYYY